jgi:hypothetical protein
MKRDFIVWYSIKALESHGRANRPGEPWIPPPAAKSAPRGRVALPFLDDGPVHIESHEIMLNPLPFLTPSRLFDFGLPHSSCLFFRGWGLAGMARD